MSENKLRMILKERIEQYIDMHTGDGWHCNCDDDHPKQLIDNLILALQQELVRMLGEEEESSDNYTYGDTSYLAKAVIYGRNEFRADMHSKIMGITNNGGSNEQHRLG